MVYDGIAYTTSSLTVTIADVNEAPSFSKNLYYANGDEGSVIQISRYQYLSWFLNSKMVWIDLLDILVYKLFYIDILGFHMVMNIKYYMNMIFNYLSNWIHVKLLYKGRYQFWNAFLWRKRPGRTFNSHIQHWVSWIWHWEKHRRTYISGWLRPWQILQPV